METTTTETDVPAAFCADAGQPVPQQPTAAVNPLPLHWFQKDAVAAAVREVKDGGRATVVAATGSGKTLIAAGCARRLAARGRVLGRSIRISASSRTASSAAVSLRLASSSRSVCM
ncbi:DEAD/DEAH box helicase family protein, partial [Kitasatospora purpeofusca]|uniref:DEAD/DEAH box helicase family protein n=1 Tax=Kitasatospora purpeofusca TaxID=67352 RepID=UPI0035DF540B